MSVSGRLVANIQIPQLALVKMPLVDDSLPDVEKAVAEALAQSPMTSELRPGMSVAVGVGSRGIANLPKLVRATIAWLHNNGAAPFIVPAMGSHGKASEEGQVELLASLGVTEDSVGCPIRATMDVVQLGVLPNGLPVYMDAFAHAADAVFIINRVKPHASFNGPHESGLVKMITIGLGKQIGADSCHTYGFAHMHENLPAMAAISLREVNILGGLGVVENFLDNTCIVEAVPAAKLMDRDAALLVEGRERLLTLPFTKLDVLIVDEMGKNISGVGMDSNVIGRFSSVHMSSHIEFTKIAVLDLTEESHGNAAGMGFANFITKRLRDKADFDAMYANCLTSLETKPMSMPPVMDNDRDAIRAAIKTCFVSRFEDIRMVNIRNTMDMHYLQVSQPLLEEAKAKGCEIVGPLKDMSFGADGELLQNEFLRKH